MSKARIGYIGVGLMGHGAAKNIVEKGYPLTIMGHRNRAPVEDLVKRGAREGKSAAEIASASDILFLCLPSSVEVEATVYGAGGVLEGGHTGLIVVDSTTADPNTSRKKYSSGLPSRQSSRAFSSHSGPALTATSMASRACASSN